MTDHDFLKSCGVSMPPVGPSIGSMVDHAKRLELAAFNEAVAACTAMTRDRDVWQERFYREREKHDQAARDLDQSRALNRLLFGCVVILLFGVAWLGQALYEARREAGALRHTVYLQSQLAPAMELSNLKLLSAGRADQRVIADMSRQLTEARIRIQACEWGWHR